MSMISKHMKKALVTGGAGFIGSHVVDALIKRGFGVLVIDDLSTGKRDNISSKAFFVKMDIRSARLEEEIQKFKPNIVFHHAAQIDVRISVEDPEVDAHINLLASVKLLEASRKAGVKKFVFASSGGAIYGGAKRIPTPETYNAKPLSPYGVSKLSFEHYLHCYEHVYGLPFVSLRYANVYGPRQSVMGEAGVIALFINKMLLGEQPMINGNGKQTRDFIYVEDAVRANMIALKPSTRGIYNIGTGVETSINGLFDTIKKLTKSSAKKNYRSAKAGEERRSVLSSQKAARELGWKPLYQLDQGLKKTVAWFKR